MDDDVADLAKALNQKNNDPLGGLRLRRGTVTAVTGGTATVTIGGVGVAGIPFYRGAWVNVNDVVDVLLDGPAARIVGVVATTSGIDGPGSVKIAEQILSATQSTIDFTNIPQNYRDLEIITEVRSTSGGNSDGLRVRMNGDTANSYQTQEVYFSGTATTPQRYTTNACVLGECVCASVNANLYSLGRCIVSRYSDATAYTNYTNHTISALTGTGPWSFFHGGYYVVASAVTQLTFFLSVASFVAGSKISIYGIR